MLQAALIAATLLAQAPQLDLVEVVGCLSQDEGGRWLLTRATRPSVVKEPATTAAAVKTAGARSLGAQQYRLIGIAPFRPERRAGRKVAARGVLIRDRGESRINVTSLQTAGEACAGP